MRFGGLPGFSGNINGGFRMASKQTGFLRPRNTGISDQHPG